IIILPMVLDSEPVPVADDIPIRIPDRNTPYQPSVSGPENGAGDPAAQGATPGQAPPAQAQAPATPTPPPDPAAAPAQPPATAQATPPAPPPETPPPAPPAAKPPAPPAAQPPAAKPP